MDGIHWKIREVIEKIFPGTVCHWDDPYEDENGDTWYSFTVMRTVRLNARTGEVRKDC